MAIRDKNTIYCTKCGYEQISDQYGLFHNEKGIGPEIRYASDWSTMIFSAQKKKILSGEERELSAATDIYMIDGRKNKFTNVGIGRLTLNEKEFLIAGSIHGDTVEIRVPIAGLPTLPFSPGKRLEIQQGNTIYRCVLEDGKLAMKFIHMLKSYYTLSCEKVKESLAR